jgi:hypothetical protein
MVDRSVSALSIVKISDPIQRANQTL